jgi:hypothetical protein
MFYSSGCHRKHHHSKTESTIGKPLPGRFAGGPIRDNLHVVIVDSATEKPLKGAIVYIHQGSPLEEKSKEVADQDGAIDFTGKGITGPVTVTVVCETKEAYDSLTIQQVDASDLIIPMQLRKEIPQTKSSLAFTGLDENDFSMSLYVNKDKEVEESIRLENNIRTISPNPYPLKVSRQPLGFLAIARDESGNPTKFGVAVLPDGPPPSIKTPTIITMDKPASGSFKTISGSLQFPPSGMEKPETGWDIARQVKIEVYADAGMGGRMVSGIGAVLPETGYKVHCCKMPDIYNMELIASISGEPDSGSETSRSYLHSRFDDLPAAYDFQFKKAPKNVRCVRSEDASFPAFEWDPCEGDIIVVSITQPKYDFNWKIYCPGGKQTQSAAMPPLPFGSSGSLLPGIEYFCRVEALTVPELDFNNLRFERVISGLTHSAASRRCSFKVAGPPEGK